MTGLAVAAAVAVPAAAQSPARHAASTGHATHHHYLSPLRVTSAYYAGYNGDLASGFDRYISKDLVLRGVNGPGQREDWLKGDLNIKAGLTGFEMTALDRSWKAKRRSPAGASAAVTPEPSSALPLRAVTSSSAASPSIASYTAGPSSTGPRATAACSWTNCAAIPPGTVHPSTR
ncbi:hypothetical protein OIF68_37965 [Actinacidiphila glaucinigra]|nr:hypothetical protein [Actinacidiphila glaucinigra]